MSSQTEHTQQTDCENSIGLKMAFFLTGQDLMTIRNEQDRTNTQKVDQSPKSEALSNGSSSVQSNLGGSGGGFPLCSTNLT